MLQTTFWTEDAGHGHYNYAFLLDGVEWEGMSITTMRLRVPQKLVRRAELLVRWDISALNDEGHGDPMLDEVEEMTWRMHKSASFKKLIGLLLVEAGFSELAAVSLCAVDSSRQADLILKDEGTVAFTAWKMMEEVVDQIKALDKSREEA